jgi:hypothetical protein
VAKLAYKPINPSKSVYDLAYAAKQFKSVRDQHIRGLLDQFICDDPPEEAWKEFCTTFALRREDGSPGSRVTHVTMNVGAATEYADLSKDACGAWRKAKQGHKGQFVWIDSGGKPKVRPVYAFESARGVSSQIENGGGKVYGFFRSGSLVTIAQPVAHTVTPLEPGIYRLNTIKTAGKVKVTDMHGKTSLEINLARFIEAQLKPLQALEAMKQATRRKHALAAQKKS